MGFNWSHAFNDRWTLRQRFDANFLDTPTTIWIVPVGLEAPAQCTLDRCGSTINNVPPPPTNFGVSVREDAVTPRFGLLWQPSPVLSLYGNYVENFGAPHFPDILGTPLPPETSKQWEVGAKTELVDGRLTSTIAWFDLTKQNITSPDPDPIRAVAGFVVLTGEVRNRGLELAVSGEVWPGVKLIASGAYIDSEITKDRGLDANGNITPGNTGHRLFAVPRFGGSFWATYEPQGEALHGLKLGAGILARSPREVDNENTFRLPGYATVNLMAGYTWKVGPSNVSLQLNVDNLLDKNYVESDGSTFGLRFGMFLGSAWNFERGAVKPPPRPSPVRKKAATRGGGVCPLPCEAGEG